MYDKKTLKTQKRYDRVARFYDSVEGLVEKRLFKDFREETIPTLRGKVLEVGVGTGKNLSYYDSRVDVTGIDLSSKMLEKAKNKASKLDKNITLL